MCFDSKPMIDLKEFIKEATPKVARKNITVYKAVIVKTLRGRKQRYTAMYHQKFVYTGAVQTSKFGINEAIGGATFFFNVATGFHSCKIRKNAMDHLSIGVETNWEQVKKFITPKGALYYENDKEYVSNKLKIIK